MTTAPAPTNATPSLGHAHATRSEPVAVAAIAILDQCRRFIGTIPDDAYAADSKSIPGGTIGKHVRHSLDHFVAAMSCLDASSTPIEYDRRARNVPMETRRGDALAVIAQLRERLAGLDSKTLGAPVGVRVMLAADGTEADLHSTLGRELAFATHHAIHHHTMMKTIAAEHGVVTPPEFGKAPSTLQYESTQGPTKSCGCGGGGCRSSVQIGRSS